MYLYVYIYIYQGKVWQFTQTGKLWNTESSSTPPPFSDATGSVENGSLEEQFFLYTLHYTKTMQSDEKSHLPTIVLIHFKKKKLDLISTSKSCLCYQNGQPVSPNFTHSILAKRKASLATSLPSQEKKSKTYPTQNWSFNLETSSHHPLLTQTHAFKSRWNMDFFRHVPLWRRNGYFGFGKTTGL